MHCLWPVVPCTSLAPHCLTASHTPYNTCTVITALRTGAQNMFPGVHHASLCLLNTNHTSVDVYTILGEGAQSPPYTSVAVAPGTLIYHALHSSTPVFIPDIISFSGPYSDLQFMHFVMGLRSVACLPLGLTQQQAVGVLRLGFDEPREWFELDKVRGISFAREWFELDKVRGAILRAWYQLCHRSGLS